MDRATFKLPVSSNTTFSEREPVGENEEWQAQGDDT